MERRALLAAVLCLFVLVVYQEALQYLYPQSQIEVGAPASSPSPEAAAPAANRDTGSAPSEPEPAPIGGAQVTVDTDLFTAHIATAGGRIESLQMKRFRAAIAAASPPLEMIQVTKGAAFPLGVRLSTEDGRTFVDDTKIIYEADRSELQVRGSESATITLRGALPAGGVIEKTFRFSGNSYPIGVQVSARDTPQPWSRVGISWRHHLEGVNQNDPGAHYSGTAVLAGKKVVRELVSAIATSPQQAFEPPVGWVSYADHYFLAALIPSEAAQTRATVSPENAGVQLLLSSPTTSDGTASFNVYVGPKDVEVLEASGFELGRAVDFGWFSFLAVPLLRLLKLFHRLSGNYGIDIILLTILVKVLFMPLTNRSMKSMRDMQKLQPQMVRLREKFKDDREQLNKEMIELYRRHRVNPLGGCLPMLLQIPVFVGLYQALSQAIELRHARFAFWVRDLSAHECYPWPGQATIIGCNDFSLFGLPIPILVLLMGGSMILQQYMAPATGMDPVQQRMMLILTPVIFTVMFISFPSGIVLYWLVNNLLTIGQQWWTNRQPA